MLSTKNSVIPIIFFVALFGFLYISLPGIVGQPHIVTPIQPHKGPFTREQLIHRFRAVINENLPATQFGLKDDAAQKLEVFIHSAAAKIAHDERNNNEDSVRQAVDALKAKLSIAVRRANPKILKVKLGDYRFIKDKVLQNSIKTNLMVVKRSPIMTTRPGVATNPNENIQTFFGTPNSLSESPYVFKNTTFGSFDAEDENEVIGEVERKELSKEEIESAFICPGFYPFC